MEASLILSIIALVGVGLTYWFLQEKIEKQKQRFRKRLQELEDRHESRILEIIESMQINYQVQLKQATEELKQQFEARLQETINFQPENDQNQTIQKTDELEEIYPAKLQNTINSLKENDKNQLLEQSTENTLIDSEDNLNFPVLEPPIPEIPSVETSFVSNLQGDEQVEQEVVAPLTPEIQPTPLEIPAVSTSSENSELGQEISDPWSEETQLTPIDTFVESTSPAFVEPEQDIVELSIQETQPTPIETDVESTASTVVEPEQDIVELSIQETQPTPIDTFVESTSSAVVEPEQDIVELSIQETQPTQIETSIESTSSAVVEPEQDIVELSIQETQPTQIETSPFSIFPENIELEEELRAQSNQEIQQEIDQALRELISVITPLTDSEDTAQSVNPTTSQKAQDITEKIIAMGKSSQVAYIPKLTEYVNHSDSRIRELVASSLGNIAAIQSQKPEVQRAIHLLGKLSRSPEPSVRQSAVEALGKIKSESVIPYLKQALRDSAPNVVKLASTAISKFKFYPINQGTKQTKMPAKILKR
ncbi:HEAT repeat domain-containing protein [Microcoleus sp. FACHB-53]|nr:HEAT repeat domain-containing protein [Microcoleus sp. FACHB-53]